MIPNATMELQIVYRAISELKASPHNPRTHSRRQIQQIATSLEKFGWTNPILTDHQGNVIAGHGRLEAARTLKLESVPTIVLDDLSPDEIRAYIIAPPLTAWNECGTAVNVILRILTESRFSGQMWAICVR